MNTIVYTAFDNIYINLTNKCSNACEFCIRTGKDSVYGSNTLWLDCEPTAKEVIEKLKSHPQFLQTEQFVFCGFGEPTYRIDEIVEVSKFLHDNKKTVRINTNGQGNLIHGYDISKKLVEAIDIINVSLNASTAKKYQEVCHSEFGEQGFYSMLELAKNCKMLGGNVIMSIVDSVGRDEVVACKQLCLELDLPLRIRKYEE